MTFLIYCLMAFIAYTGSLAGFENDEQALISKLEAQVNARLEFDRGVILRNIPIACEKILELAPSEIIMAVSPKGNRAFVFLSDTLTYAMYDVQMRQKIADIPDHKCCNTIPVCAFDEQGATFALASHCFENTNGPKDILTFLTLPDDKQVFQIPNFQTEVLALSGDGRMAACTSGCGEQGIMLFARDEQNQFVQKSIFGKGHFLALNHDGSKIAVLNHGELAIFENTQTDDVPRQLCTLSIGDISRLRFSDLEVLQVPMENLKDDYASVLSGSSLCARKIIVNCQIRGLTQVNIATVGNKLIGLKDGAPCFIYFIGGKQNCSLELEKPDQKINAMQLIDDDSALFASTNNALYRYDLKRLCAQEMKYIKPVDQIDPQDVIEAHQKKSSSQWQFPLLGAATIAFALCALCQ